MEITKGDSKEIKSKSVDGLGLCVELSDRTMYLKVNEREITSEWLPSLYFADWLDAGKTQVDKIIGDLKIEGRFDENFGEIVYPPLTFELVAEEYSWIQKCKTLNPTLTPVEIGELLDRDYRYITKESSELGYSLRKGKLPQAVLTKIRKEELSIPFDEGWYTLRGLALAVVKDREWVSNRLDKLGIISEKRKSLESGITLEYYPPESLALVMKCIREIPKYGDDWYTCGRICQETGKSLHWVSSRLGEYIEVSESRLDDMRVSRLHYPKYVFDILSAQAEVTAAKSDSDGWLTIKEIAGILGINERSTSRKLDNIGLVSERRKMSDGKVVYHYNPVEIAKIIEENEKYIDASSLSRKIGKSAYVICLKLANMGIDSVESRYDSRPRKLYPLSVIDLLKDE